MVRTRTVIDDGGQQAAPEPHRIEPAPVFQPAPIPQAHERKITGVLVTYTWQPQGQLFPLYEGRNVIGSGTVESEGGRDCDIQIANDRMLSNEHAAILCRRGRYDLLDRFSANGTYLDGEFVESQGAKLRDCATIKTGATVWLFRMIQDSPQATPSSAYASPVEPPAQQPQQQPSQEPQPQPTPPAATRPKTAPGDPG